MLFLKLWGAKARLLVNEVKGKWYLHARFLVVSRVIFSFFFLSSFNFFYSFPLTPSQINCNNLYKLYFFKKIGPVFKLFFSNHRKKSNNFLQYCKTWTFLWCCKTRKTRWTEEKKFSPKYIIIKIIEIFIWLRFYTFSNFYLYLQWKDFFDFLVVDCIPFYPTAWSTLLQNPCNHCKTLGTTPKIIITKVLTIAVRK